MFLRNSAFQFIIWEYIYSFFSFIHWRAKTHRCQNRRTHTILRKVEIVKSKMNIFDTVFSDVGKSKGYDEPKFKCSLVIDEINYVMFDESACKPLLSKLYTVAQVRYDVSSVFINSHLNDIMVMI